MYKLVYFTPCEEYPQGEYRVISKSLYFFILINSKEDDKIVLVESFNSEDEALKELREYTLSLKQEYSMLNRHISGQIGAWI